MTRIILKDSTVLETEIKIEVIENHLRNQGWVYINDLLHKCIISKDNFDIIHELGGD